MKSLSFFSAVTGRTDNKTTYAVSVGLMTQYQKAVLLRRLDEWYGTTDQDVEVWAVEYQMWASSLLSDVKDAFIIINPQFLEMNEVDKQLKQLLGSKYEDYVLAKEMVHSGHVEKIFEQRRIEHGVVISIEIPKDMAPPKRKFRVDVTKSGFLYVMADSEDAALEIAEKQSDDMVSWCDDWSFECNEDEDAPEDQCINE